MKSELSILRKNKCPQKSWNVSPKFEIGGHTVTDGDKQTKIVEITGGDKQTASKTDMTSEYYCVVTETQCGTTDLCVYWSEVECTPLNYVNVGTSIE